MSRPDIHTAQTLEDPITIPYDTVVNAMTKGVVDDELGLMRWGSNYTFLVSVTHTADNTSFLAIYKPRAGERPLWDFPDGTLYKREVASYVVSEALGWSVVPPTIVHDGPRGVGSLQTFIEHDPERHYFTFEDCHSQQLRRIAAFDAITNNADRKGGHCLLDTDGHIWGIDHGLTFHPMNKLRTVIWDFAGLTIQQDVMDDLAKLCAQLDDAGTDLSTHLQDLLAAQEIQAMKRRVDRLLQRATYPEPGPGPNRPWPAV
jgi:hypothetical protein